MIFFFTEIVLNSVKVSCGRMSKGGEVKRLRVNFFPLFNDINVNKLISLNNDIKSTRRNCSCIAEWQVAHVRSIQMES